MFKALQARLKKVEADKTGAAKAATETEADTVTSNHGLLALALSGRFDAAMTLTLSPLSRKVRAAA